MSSNKIEIFQHTSILLHDIIFEIAGNKTRAQQLKFILDLDVAISDTSFTEKLIIALFKSLKNDSDRAGMLGLIKKLERIA